MKTAICYIFVSHIKKNLLIYLHLLIFLRIYQYSASTKFKMKENK
jgi:hypothetical protein